MAKGLILDPTAALADDIASPGPEVGALAGKTVGFRVDILWRSWDWVSEIWAEELRKEGATVKFWRSAGRTGAAGERAAKELAEFIRSIDVAIVGLANCGSCTSWTIHDALRAAETGIPTVAICTKHFEDLGAALSKRGGRSGLRRFILPYPLDILPREQVDGIARDHYRPFLRAFGVRTGLAVQPAA